MNRYRLSMMLSIVLGLFCSSQLLADDREASKVPEAFHGFRGILVGKLVSKDVEKGTADIKFEEVKRVWKQSKAKDPKSAVGKTLKTEGISGKFLDVLLVLEKGDAVEIESFHVSGDNLSFSGEWLKRAQ